MQVSVRTKVLPQFMKALRAGATSRLPRTEAGVYPAGKQRKGNYSMTYWRLHYHIIWSTMDRQSLLTPNVEKIFYGVIYQKAKELDLKVHAAGNVDDHAHVVLSIPPKIAVADCVRQLKGASAYAINHRDGGDRQFKWQAGYGALTIGDRSLNIVMEYVARQKEHHKVGTIIGVYERIEEVK